MKQLILFISGLLFGVLVLWLGTMMIQAHNASCEYKQHWQDVTVLSKRIYANKGVQEVFYGMDNNIVYHADVSDFERGDKVELFESNCSDIVKLNKVGHIELPL